MLSSGLNTFSQNALSLSAYSSTQPVSIPYSMQGAKLMVPAFVNGCELLMRFDTGCRRCIIPIDFVESIGLQRPVGPPDGRYKKTGSAIWKTRVDVRLGGLRRSEMTVDIFDGNVWPGTPVLGNDFFEGYSKFVRTYEQAIHLIPMSDPQPAKKMFQAKPLVIPFRRDSKRGTPILDASVGGSSFEVLFDTGANDALWLTREQAGNFGILNRGSNISVGRSQVACTKTIIPSLSLGALSLTNVKTIICDSSRATWATDYACLGTALLSAHDYLIDEVSQLIYIGTARRF